MDEDSVDTCSICMDLYDGNVRPRGLPCGHTFCTSCITNSLSGGRVSCPNCQKPHLAASANDFPIIYTLEAVIAELRKAKLGAIPKQQTRSNSGTSQPGSKWQSVFNDDKDRLRNLIQHIEDMQKEMSNYKEFLSKRKAEHEEVIPKIYALAHRNEEIVEQIDKENEVLTEVMKEGKDLKNEAEGTLRKFNNAKSTKDIIKGSEEVGNCYEILDEWKMRSQKQLPNTKTIKHSEKILRETTTALSTISVDIEDDTKDVLDADSLSMPIMKKLDFIKKGCRTVSTEELLSITPYARRMLEEGQVYAVQKMKGKIRSARVSIKNDKIYLHYLQDKEPPPNSHIMQQGDLISNLKVDSAVVFMDLSWDGKVQGRIHIRLSPDTPLGSHFQSLCTGDRGPSYARSKLLSVAFKNKDLERVNGGDYERGDGTGGAPLFPGLNPRDVIYSRQNDAGIIWATNLYDRDGPKSAQFTISTRKANSDIYAGVFGQVQDGLKILRKAVSVSDIQKVLIDDCGVVLRY